MADHSGLPSTRSAHLVDPTFQLLIDFMPTLTFDAELLQQVRTMRAAAVPPEHVPAPGLTTTRRTVPGPPGAPDVGVSVTSPLEPRAGRPGVLWIHGGGYILGSVGESLPFVDRLALALDCVVVAVEYRLAPDTPHPGPLEDCHAALVWLGSAVGELGVDPRSIAVVGESAGGGLAAALALLARDRVSVPLCFQGLVYPMIDDRSAVDRDTNEFAGEYIWNRASNDFGWASLLGHEPGRDVVAPYAVAARAEDLSGLPPTFIGVGALDLFVEENIEYARRLLRAGVPTELHVHPGAIHGYLQLGDFIPKGKLLFDLLVEALSGLLPTSCAD